MDTTDSTDSFSDDTDPREVAERFRYSQERLRDAYEKAPSPRTYRVWAACIALTVGWGKTADRTFASTIEAQAGLAKGKASAPLRDLHDRGVLVWQKDKGQRSVGWLALPPLSTVRGEGAAKAPISAPAPRHQGRPPAWLAEELSVAEGGRCPRHPTRMNHNGVCPGCWEEENAPC